jgi:hypothetical protein
MKTKIKKESDSLDSPFVHLLPIVRFLIEQGNEPIDPRVFYNTQDGWRCDLKHRINFETIKTNFDLPESIVLNENKGVIWCRNSWIEIQGSI